MALGSQVLAEVVEVAGEDTPADVPDEAVLAMIRTAAEAIITPQAAQSPLDPRAPAIPSAPGARSLLGSLRCAHWPGARDHQLRDSRLLGEPLILGGMHPSVAGDEPRCSAKHLLVVVQGGSQLPLLGGLVFQHRTARDDLRLDRRLLQHPSSASRARLLPVGRVRAAHSVLEAVA